MESTWNHQLSGWTFPWLTNLEKKQDFSINKNPNIKYDLLEPQILHNLTVSFRGVPLLFSTQWSDLKSFLNVLWVCSHLRAPSWLLCVRCSNNKTSPFSPLLTPTQTWYIRTINRQNKSLMRRWCLLKQLILVAEIWCILEMIKWADVSHKAWCFSPFSLYDCTYCSQEK